MRVAQTSSRSGKEYERFGLVVNKTSRNLFIALSPAKRNCTITIVSTLSLANHYSILHKKNRIRALLIGKILAQRTISSGIRAICFERFRFKYHGLIKAVAEAARNYGLQF